jgi:hypothetical protein
MVVDKIGRSWNDDDIVISHAKYDDIVRSHAKCRWFSETLSSIITLSI